MNNYTLQELARAVGGRIIGGDKTNTYNAVSIDSRRVVDNGIFFALKGEASDGHLYIKNACENGAGVVIASKETQNIAAAQIIVTDTFEALKLLAKDYIKKFNIPFVAVTGSSGKTTTKDIVAGVLSARYCVHKTKGNLNSTTGVPLTIFDLEDKHQIAVIEMSMSHPGEILGNADIVRPDTALITNIGTCHMEYLKSQDNIFRAKCEILHYLNEDNCAVVNADDEYLSRLDTQKYKLVKVGLSECDYTAYDIRQSPEGVSFCARVYGREERFDFAIPGMHNVTNCLMAIAVGVRYSLSVEEIKIGLKLFRLSANRMEIVRKCGITLINDTYNANPEAVKAAAGTLAALGKDGRRIAVLGDMYELGANAAKLHETCGGYLAGQNIDLLLTCGEYGYNYKKGYEKESKNGRCIAFENKREISEYLKKNVKAGDAVLFKASHSVKLEEVFLSVKGILADE